MKRSGIAWTDYSGGNLNFVRRGQAGDCEASPGCDHCYALRVGERFGNLPEATTVYPEKLERLLMQRFPRVDRGGGLVRPMAFVCDTGDLFHDNVSDWMINRAFSIFTFRPDVVWQVLTKRADRMLEFVRWWIGQPHGDPQVPAHIWLGVTAENQAMADERIPLLLQAPAAVRFVSFEPMLGPVDIGRYVPSLQERCLGFLGDVRGPAASLFRKSSDPYLDWCIVGGESGPAARPMHPNWVRSLRDQCVEAGVSFLLKQRGEYLATNEVIAYNVAVTKDGLTRVGIRQAGRLLDGREWMEFPEGR
jgi:protein gp37